MSRSRYSLIAAVCAGLALGFGSLLETGAPAAGGKDPKKTAKKDAKKDTKKDVKKDNEAGLYFKQLQARFGVWDTNNDNVLDKNELAKAFRGPKAQPYDKLVKVDFPVPPPPPPQPPAEKKVRRMSLVLLCLPRPSLFVNAAVAELLTEPVKSTKVISPPPIIAPPPINYTALPDYVFTSMVSKNRDGKISKQEFEAWAREYARMLDNHEDTQQAVKTASQRLQNAKTADARKKAQIELQQHQRELSVVSARLKSVPPAIHAALKIRK
jgi:hypothetical protein